MKNIIPLKGLGFILIVAVMLSCNSEEEELRRDIRLSFFADTPFVCEYECVNFNGICNVDPEKWEWIFEGGDPDKSDIKNPKEIKYCQTGSYDVSLKVTYQDQEYVYKVKDYIRVDPGNKGNFTFSQLCAENDTIKAGQHTKIWAECTGDSLNYFWSATKGHILGSGREVTLSTCFCDKGVSEITCTVKHALGHTIKRKINIVIK